MLPCQYAEAAGRSPAEAVAIQAARTPTCRCGLNDQRGAWLCAGIALHGQGACLTLLVPVALRGPRCLFHISRPERSLVIRTSRLTQSSAEGVQCATLHTVS